MTEAVRPTADLDHVRRIVRSCSRRFGRSLPPDELDDVVQDVALVAWKRRHEFHGRSACETWLYGIARHMILRRCRRRWRRREEPLPSRTESEPLVHEERSVASRVDTALWRQIEAGVRAEGTTLDAILRARVLEGRSFARIARRLGLSEASVKGRLYRSMPEVRRRLGGLWRDVLR